MGSPFAIVLDHDSAVRDSIAGALRAAGLEVATATTSQDALDVVRTRPVAVAVFGAAAGGKAVYDLVERTQRLSPSTVIAVVDADDGPAVVAAARAGAFEVLRRPPATDRLTAFSLRALRQHGILEQLRRSRGDGDGERLAGRSALAEGLRREVQRLAASRAPALFAGESGSGRSYAARCLHALSARGEPLAVLDAAADPTLVAARLFGGPKAGASRPATPLLAAPGDLFVGSVEALTWEAQGALGDALASGRVPGRVLVSTALDPETAVRDGRLHPRLAAAFEDAVISVPPLRARIEDVAVLARVFVDTLQRLNGLPAIALSPDALAALEGYEWPGNVRELRNAVETAVILATDGTVRAKDLPASVRGGTGPTETGVRADRRFRDAKRSVVDAFERSYLSDLLRRHGGNVTAAAEQSGMLRSALQRLLRKHDLRSARFRGGAGAEADGA